MKWALTLKALYPENLVSHQDATGLKSKWPSTEQHSSPLKRAAKSE